MIPKMLHCLMYKLCFVVLESRQKNMANHLKESVLRETWGLSGKHVKGYSLYTEALRTAYVVLKAYQVDELVFVFLVPYIWR